MEKSVPINELDVFYISYDEPRKEEHWAKILDNVPWAKRVDGVKGFDNAHKECARPVSYTHLTLPTRDDV